MDDTEKRLERAEKHSDGKKKHRKEWEKGNGIPVFYQQPKRRHRNHKPCSKRPLEHREHALASGCNISRRRKRNTGENVSAESEYNQEMELKHIKANGTYKKEIINEESLSCLVTCN